MNYKIIWWSVGIIITIAIMILFPILTNILMFVGDYKVAGDDKTWIGYLGSFWGAIIGGVISGAITLIGVQITISNQDRKEFINLYPQRKIALDNYITSSNKVKGYLLEAFGAKRNVIIQGEFYKKVDNYKNGLETTLTEIVKVDPGSYTYAKSLLEELGKIKKYVRYDLVHVKDDPNESFEGYFVTDKLKYNESLERIKKLIVEIENINNKLDNKFNKLTGN